MKYQLIKSLTTNAAPMHAFANPCAREALALGGDMRS
jgi:hypothetical protein